MVAKTPRIQVSSIKAAVDKILVERRLTTKWLYERIGFSKTGYRDMWAEQTVRLTVLQQIADALEVPLLDLLYGPTKAGKGTPSELAEPTVPYGAGRFIEERLTDLETDVRKLKELVRAR